MNVGLVLTRFLRQVACNLTQYAHHAVDQRKGNTDTTFCISVAHFIILYAHNIRSVT